MGELKPEYAAEFQQQVIAHCDLAPEVPEGTRRAALSVSACSTATASSATKGSLLPTTWPGSCWSRALRERFIALYNEVIPLVQAKTCEQRPLTASNFAAVDEAFRPGGSHAEGRPRRHSSASLPSGVPPASNQVSVQSPGEVDPGSHLPDRQSARLQTAAGQPRLY
jgi:hypothetical protein